MLTALIERKGMTLVEVIVALALFGIVAAMAISILTTSMLLSMRSSDNTLQTARVNEDLATAISETADGTSASAVVYFNQSMGTSSGAIQGNVLTESSSGNLSDAEMRTFVPED